VVVAVAVHSASTGDHTLMNSRLYPPDVHYVYVLECADGTYYTGYTTDVERRVAEHDADEGAKYTRGRTPVELVHAERYDSRSAAMSREHEIKSLSRRAKERLVADTDAD
jgi:putative endonuclease